MPTDLRRAKKETTIAVTHLGRLIARLALDDSLHRAYLENADAVIRQAGLSRQETEALKTGNWPRILHLLGPGDRGGLGDARKDPGDGE